MSDLSILENHHSFENIEKSGYEIIKSDRYLIQGGDMFELKTATGLVGVVGINTLFTNLYLAGQLDTISDMDIEDMEPTLLESKLAKNAVQKMEKIVKDLESNYFNEPKSKLNSKNELNTLYEPYSAQLVEIEVRP